MIAILTGLSQEAGVIQDRSTALVLCGLKDLAAMETMIPASCPGILGFSVVGGLSPRIKVGDVCLAKSAVTGDGKTHAPDSGWMDRIAAALAKGGVTPIEAVFFTDPRELAGTPAERKALFERTGAECVDMGTYAIAAWAEKHGKPWATIGTISDQWDQAVPTDPKIMNPDGSPNIFQILQDAKGNPAMFKQLMAVAHTFTQAINALRAVYTVLWPTWCL